MGRPASTHQHGMNNVKPLTYQEALDMYYGGMKTINKSVLPFTCKCGDRSASNVSGMWSHIRKSHREKIIY